MINRQIYKLLIAIGRAVGVEGGRDEDNEIALLKAIAVAVGIEKSRARECGVDLQDVPIPIAESEYRQLAQNLLRAGMIDGPEFEERIRLSLGAEMIQRLTGARTQEDKSEDPAMVDGSRRHGGRGPI